MMLGLAIGPWEFLILVAVIAFLFGSRRVTAAVRSVGRGAREFKESVKGEDDDEEPKEPPPRLEQ
jgi:TatA/E family protein of Tat protein translocase